MTEIDRITADKELIEKWPFQDGEKVFHVTHGECQVRTIATFGLSLTSNGKVIDTTFNNGYGYGAKFRSIYHLQESVNIQRRTPLGFDPTGRPIFVTDWVCYCHKDDLIIRDVEVFCWENRIGKESDEVSPMFVKEEDLKEWIEGFKSK